MKKENSIKAGWTSSGLGGLMKELRASEAAERASQIPSSSLYLLLFLPQLELISGFFFLICLNFNHIV